LAARKREKKQTYTGQVFAFMGAKGGCGVTTLATQLSALLASSRKKTLLFDLHPDLGDVALYLGVTKTDYHFFELLENTDRLDADFLQSFLVRHSSGLDLIPAPERRDNPRHIAAGAVTQALDFLRGKFEFVVADLPAGFSDEAFEVIQNCDQLYLVTVAEVAAVRNLVRQVDYFTRKDVPAEKIRIIVNRHQKRSLVSDEQIEKVVGQKIYWRVPNQYPEVVKAIHEGNPVAQTSSSEVSRSVKDWAATLVKRPDEESKKQNGKFLGLWGR
jgi:pilus assembly protein CpaE